MNVEPAATGIDDAATDTFADRVLGDYAGANAFFLAGIGDRLGLFTELAAHGPAVGEELAGRTGLQERYLREWLGGMAAAGSVTVPAGIGIGIADPGVHRRQVDGATSYGYIKECPSPCISPLHTHDVTGVIHVEAPVRTTFTLGELFREWDVRLDASCVGGYCGPAARIVVFVDGRRRRGNPATIELAPDEEIAVVIGSPPSSIPATFDMPPGA